MVNGQMVIRTLEIGTVEEEYDDREEVRWLLVDLSCHAFCPWPFS
jgi:hypothetical protein